MDSLEPLILAIDDDPGILSVLRLHLTDEGYRVVTAASGEEGLRILQEQRPVLVLLDIMLPGISGYDVLREMRSKPNSPPVILLTARRDDMDKVHGLEAGADDYLAKPFGLDELSARGRAILRRTAVHPIAGNFVQAHDIEIDLDGRTVRRAGELLALTRTEWSLLEYLARNASKVMPNSDILEAVWGEQFAGDVQYLRVWMSRLRDKIEDEGAGERVIRTFRGVGYMLNAQGGPAAAPVPPVYTRADRRVTGERA